MKKNAPGRDRSRFRLQSVTNMIILTSRNMLNITSAVDLSSVTNETDLYYIFLILKFIIQHIDQLFQENHSAMSHLSMCLHTGIYIGFQAT